MNFFRGLALALVESALLWAVIVGAVLWLLSVDRLTAAVALLCGSALLFHALVRITEP